MRLVTNLHSQLLINNVQETVSYTVTADDIGANSAATAQSIATNIATDLSPSNFTITQDGANLGQLTIAAAHDYRPVNTRLRLESQ